MTENANKSEKRRNQRGGKILPALCSVLGTLILVLVILSALPLALPRLLGMSAYSVVSGSMEPALPVGSLVLVEPVEFAAVRQGDVIAFSDGGVTVTHRVVQILPEKNQFITKGDANDTPDISPVAYVNTLGRVKAHVPYLGQLGLLYAAPSGKLTMVVFAVCGLLFRLTASFLRSGTKTPQNEDKAPKTKNGEDTSGKENEAS